MRVCKLCTIVRTNIRFFDTTQEVHPGVHAVAILCSWLSDKARYKFDASMFPQDHGKEVVSTLIISREKINILKS